MAGNGTPDRLSMPLGEALYTQRAIRRLKPDPIPEADLRLILEAATRAPSGGNSQPWHFLVLRDPDRRRRFAALYREAWWAKRRDVGIMGPEDIPPRNTVMLSARRLAEAIGEAPVIVLLLSREPGPMGMGSVIPAAQNLLLAARGLGIGGAVTTLHACADERVHALLGIPESVQVVYCLPLGYPQGRFGPLNRKPLPVVTSEDRWGAPPAWV